MKMEVGMHHMHGNIMLLTAEYTPCEHKYATCASHSSRSRGTHNLIRPTVAQIQKVTKTMLPRNFFIANC